MAQLVTCLPGEHEGPWSDAIHTPCESLAQWHMSFFHWRLEAEGSLELADQEV